MSYEQIDDENIAAVNAAAEDMDLRATRSASGRKPFTIDDALEVFEAIGRFHSNRADYDEYSAKRLIEIRNIYKRFLLEKKRRDRSLL